MKWSWRWMIGDYVPIESGMLYAERREFLKPIFKSKISTPIPALFGGFSGVAFVMIMTLGRRVIPLPIVFVYVLLLGLIFNFAFGFFIARRVAPSIYRELRERGIDLCPNCNYDLRERAAGSATCPECGVEREPMPPPISESRP